MERVQHKASLDWIALVGLVVAIIVAVLGVVNWSYATFTPVKQYDSNRADDDKRFDRIEAKQDQTNDKLDKILEQTK